MAKTKIARAARLKLVAKALVQGKTQAEAAKAAGYSPANAGRLANDPATIAEVQRLTAALDRKSLTVDRIAQELDKGLTNGKLSAHGDYLDKLIKIKGLYKEQEATNGQALGQDIVKGLMQAFADARAAGIISRPTPSPRNPYLETYKLDDDKARNNKDNSSDDEAGKK